MASCNIGKSTCLSCAQGKGCKLPSTSKYHDRHYGETNLQFLEVVHSDTCGPINPVSYPRRNRYFQVFTEGKSRYTTIVLLKKKSEGPQKFKDYRKKVERATGRKIKWFKTDNGTEYKNSATKRYFKKKGIRHITSAAYRPSSNGTSERLIRRVVELAKTLMFTSGCPSYLWDYAIKYAAYLHNRLPSATLEYQSPYKVWNEFEPSYKRFHVWGCNATVHVPKPKRSKFGSSALKGAFVGVVGDDSGQYLCYIPSLKSVVRSSDVVFDEPNFSVISARSGVIPNGITHETTENQIPDGKVANWEIEEDSTDSESQGHGHEDSSDHDIALSDSSDDDSGDSSDDSDEDSDDDDEYDTPCPPSRKRTRQQPLPEDNDTPPPGGLNRRPGEIFLRNENGQRTSARVNKGRHRNRENGALFVTVPIDEDEQAFLTHDAYIHESIIDVVTGTPVPYVSSAIDDPTTYTYEQARFHPSHSSEWKSAIESELESIEKNRVWEPEELPEGKTPISVKWIFKHKLHMDNSIARFKARLVARGFTQRKSIDYNETYASVVKFPSIRLFFSLAASKGWAVHQMDAKTAFLCSEIDSAVWVAIPEGYKLPPGSNLKRPALRLRKGLYGLKQSPRLWQKRLTDYLLSIGFTQSQFDACIFAKENVMVAVYVDDILVTGATTHDIETFKADMTREFEMTDGGPATFFLGIQIKTVRGPRVDVNGNYYENEIVSYQLTQEHYVKKILAMYDMSGCAEAPTPLTQLFAKKKEKDKPTTKSIYQSCIGSLMYLMLGTRPDIAFAVSHLSSFCADPSDNHWNAVKRVLRYIKGTANLGLHLGGNHSHFNRLRHAHGNISPVYGFTDADWASDQVDRRSVSTYQFFFKGSLISWASRKQTFVATSTMESEYVAAAHGAKEAVWMRSIVDELNTLAHLKIPKLKGNYTQSFTRDRTHLDRDENIVTRFEGSRLKPITTIFADSEACIRVAYNPELHKFAKHIDINYHFLRQRVRMDYIRMAHVTTHDNIADYLTKNLTPEKFKACREDSGIKIVN